MSETAEAYLRSSAATGGVPLKSRFNMMIKENPIPMKVALANSGHEFKFLGPQLQVITVMFLSSCKALRVGVTLQMQMWNKISTPLQSYLNLKNLFKFCQKKQIK